LTLDVLRLDEERQVIGKHLIADMYGVEPNRLADAGFLRDVLAEATRASGLRPIAEPVVVPFAARSGCATSGVTGFILLAESHIALHTYPEHGFAGVDVFTCGAAADPWAVVRVFQERLQPARVETVEHVRGKEAVGSRQGAGGRGQ
jgi:S-adenosylmethionine decarboxylase